MILEASENCQTKQKRFRVIASMEEGVNGFGDFRRIMTKISIFG